MSITPTHIPKPLRSKSSHQNKENLQFKSIYSSKDFAVVQKIITKAEKSKQIQKKRCQSASNSITLSEIIEAYKKVMIKMNIEVLNETHYYAMIIKLSLNQHGKTWRECLQYEMKKSQMKRQALQQYKVMSIKKFFCRWIERYIQTYREQTNKSMMNSQNQSQMLKLETDRYMLSTIKQQLTPLSQNSALLEIQNQNRSNPQLFTNNAIQETEFLKNIINLSGSKSFVKPNVENQRNASQYLVNMMGQTTSAQNNLLTTAMTPQLSKQDLKITYEPTQTELRSLERSYQKRKKENALMTMGKFMMKQLKYYSFANSDPSIHLLKAFRRWNYKAQIMTQILAKKEQFINKWMKAYEHFNIKQQQKVFQAIKETGVKLRIMQQNELKVRAHFESKLTNLIFLQWAEKFNRRVSYRNNLFKATKYWAKNVQEKHMLMWKIYINEQKNIKMKFRNFQMIRMVKSFLQNGVPRKLYKDQKTFADQLQTLVVIRNLKSLDQQEFDKTIYLYEMQYKAAVFDAIKQHYVKISEFKALQMIRVCYKSIVLWKGHIQNKIWMRQKQDEFLENIVVKKYKNILKIWQSYSHQQNRLKQRMFCFQKKNNYKLLDKTMTGLFKNYKKRVLSYKNNTTSNLFLRQNLFVKTLVSLEHNRRLQKAQRIFLQSKYQSLRIFHQKRILNSLFNLTLKRKQARLISQSIIQQKSFLQQRDIFVSWINSAFHLKRANYFWKKNTFRKAIDLLKTGIQNQKYLQRCDKKGQQIYKKNLKQRLIVFLREALYEIEMRKQLFTQLLQEAYYSKLGKLYRGFIMYRQQKIIRSEQIYICNQICVENKKRTALNILKYNAYQNYHVREKIFNYQQNLKFEMFQYLKYSVQKSQQLRENYYDFIVDKSRLKATLMLVHWQNKTIQRNFRRQTLNQRIEYFMKHRYFRNQNRRKAIKAYYEQKLEIFQLYKLKQTQYNVIQGILMYINSEYHQNDKKARHHYKQALIIKTISTLKRKRYLSKLGEFIEGSLLQDKLKKFYNIWHAAFLNQQANKEAQDYLITKKAKRLFRAWRGTTQSVQKERLNESLALYQYENHLKLRLIHFLRLNIEQKSNQQNELQMLDVKAYWFKLMKLFNEWKKQADYQKILKQKQYTLEIYMKQKMVSVYYQNFKKAFRYSIMIKDHQENNNLSILEKYFRILKHDYKSAKIGNYLNLESDKHHSKQLVQKTFSQLVQYARMRKQQKIKSLQSSIWYFRRIILKFISQLKSEVSSSQYYAEKSSLIQSNRVQNLIKNAFKSWFKEVKFQVNSRNAEIYRKKKSFKRFQYQLSSQKANKQLKEHKELKVIELLAYKLQKRAFYGLKMFKQFLSYKNQLETLKERYQTRKWFDTWRTNYMHKGEFNYLNFDQNDKNNMMDINNQSLNISFRASEFNANNKLKSAMKRNVQTPLQNRRDYSYLSGGGFLGNKIEFQQI